MGKWNFRKFIKSDYKPSYIVPSVVLSNSGLFAIAKLLERIVEKKEKREINLI